MRTYPAWDVIGVVAKCSDIRTLVISKRENDKLQFSTDLAGYSNRTLRLIECLVNLPTRRSKRFQYRFVEQIFKFTMLQSTKAVRLKIPHPFKKLLDEPVAFGRHANIIEIQYPLIERQSVVGEPVEP